MPPKSVYTPLLFGDCGGGKNRVFGGVLAGGRFGEQARVQFV
jgi:hypothetical protein